MLGGARPAGFVWGERIKPWMNSSQSGLVDRPKNSRPIIPSAAWTTIACPVNGFAGGSDRSMWTS
jgi:hypothetical protein